MSSDNKVLNQTIIRYLIYSGVLLVFTFVYELFSHGVTSRNMRLSIFFPLVLGSVLFNIFRFLPKPSKIARDLWGMAITTAVSGLILEGVFYIYGTHKDIVHLFFWGAGIIFLITIVLYTFQTIQHKKLG
jgi:hypothetical protein